MLLSYFLTEKVTKRLHRPAGYGNMGDVGNVAAKMSLTFRTRRRAVISVGVTISGMTGRGSIRHNNRSFSAANIDRSRTGLNVTFCQEDLKQVYHQVFDEALAAYNAKKKKTRDKIPDYYEHIRQGKQEKLFHEVIFQIGNKDECRILPRPVMPEIVTPMEITAFPLSYNVSDILSATLPTSPMLPYAAG